MKRKLRKTEISCSELKNKARGADGRTEGPEALSFPMVMSLSLNFSAFVVRTSLLHWVKIKLINTQYDPAEATHAFQASDREVETVSKTGRARQIN